MKPNLAERIVEAAGRVAMATLLLLLIFQFGAVLGRYVFGLNFLWAQEAATYAFAATFMLASAWTLFCGKHVRIDILADRIPQRAVVRLGFLLCLVPLMLAILYFSYPYVAESWSILEGSQEVSGLPGKFLLKTLISIFALLMLVAGIATLRKA